MDSVSFNFQGAIIHIYDMDSKDNEALKIITTNALYKIRTPEELKTTLIERFPHVTVDIVYKYK